MPRRRERGRRARIVADRPARACALDVIVPDAELRELATGGVLAFLDTGAYQDAAASTSTPSPGRNSARLRRIRQLIRRHEIVDEVFARDLSPALLRSGRGDGEAGSGRELAGDGGSTTSR